MARTTSDVGALSAYRVLRHLGAGGMGTLSLAEGPDGVVVLKRPIIGKATPQAIALAEREATISASLDHPGIVHVLGVLDDDGIPVLVMEHLIGLTLFEIGRRARQRSMPIALEPIMAAMAQVARALHYLHTRTDEEGRPRGLVHRDISPDNLFVTDDGTLKLLDFGVARADDLDSLTRVGGLRGKRGFFAPELIGGHPADARTDLFALGATFYMLICGQLPWGRLDPGPAFIAMREGPPAPPSSLNASLPRAVDDLVLRLLATDPAARWSSGDDVAAAIELLIARVSPSVTNPVRLIETFGDVDNDDHDDDETIGVAPVESSRPVQRWDRAGASSVEDEDTRAATRRPPQSATAVVRTLHVYGRGPRRDESETAALSVHPSIVAAPTVTMQAALPRSNTPASHAHSRSQSQSAPTRSVLERRGTSMASRRPRQVGIAVGLGLGLIIVVGLAWSAVQAPSLPPSPPAPPEVASTTSLPSPVVPVAPPPVAVLPPPPVAVPPPLPPPVVVPTPSPPPSPPPPPSRVRVARTERVATRGPERVQWLVGTRTGRTGPGSLEVPAGTRSVRAKDPKRGVTSTVPITDGVADYDALPRAQVLLRARPWAVVTIGNEALGQTPLSPVTAVPGRYTVRFTKDGTTITREVVVAGGKTVKVNVDMDGGADEEP